MKRLLATLTVAIWAVLLLSGAFRPQPETAGEAARPDVGYMAPPFTLKDAAGKEVSLADLRGQAVFLNFWASWCGPCRLEMPELERLQAELPPGTAILTVNVTAQESSPEVALGYLREHGYTFPVVLDPDGSVSNQYRVISLPTSLFLSPDGVVTARINGPLARSAMLGYLQAAGGPGR